MVEAERRYYPRISMLVPRMLGAPNESPHLRNLIQVTELMHVRVVGEICERIRR
jgi:hypothetical protein